MSPTEMGLCLFICYGLIWKLSWLIPFCSDISPYAELAPFLHKPTHMEADISNLTYLHPEHNVFKLWSRL